MRYKQSVMLVLLVLMHISSVKAKTWYIQPDGSGDAPTIQAGCDSASYGDTVLAAPGTYIGEGNRDIFVGKTITVTSETGATGTIIDCENAAIGFDIGYGTGSSTVVSGFTIVNGYGSHGGGLNCGGGGPTIQDLIIENCEGYIYGGGVYCSYSYAQISNVKVIGCRSPYGGGIWLHQCNSFMSISFSTVADNWATYTGGGIVFDQSSPTMMNCTIVGNGAPAGGQLFCWGDEARPQIFRSIVAYGTAGQGVTCTGQPEPTFSCCDIFGNVGGDDLCGFDGLNNFSLDPEFCSTAEAPEYWLDHGSPCWVTNSPCGMLIGAWPLQCEDGVGVPSNVPMTGLELQNGRPNPFKATTLVGFTAPVGAAISVIIYDVRGRKIRTLVQNRILAAREVLWDGQDDSGQKVASGVYFCRLTTKSNSIARKIVLAR